MNIRMVRHHHIYPYLLVLVPTMVHIVGTIIQDYVFWGLIYFISLIFSNWDLVNDINTDVIYLWHIQYLIDIRLATQTQLLDYLNYLCYIQQRLKSLFSHCDVIVLFRLLYAWNLIEIFKSECWNNVWESCQIIGKDN